MLVEILYGNSRFLAESQIDEFNDLLFLVQNFGVFDGQLSLVEILCVSRNGSVVPGADVF